MNQYSKQDLGFNFIISLENISTSLRRKVEDNFLSQGLMPLESISRGVEIIFWLFALQIVPRFSLSNIGSPFNSDQIIALLFAWV